MVLKRKWLVFGVFGFIAGAMLLLSRSNFTNSNKAVAVFPDTVSLSKHWEKAIPHQSVPPGLSSLSAQSCGSCHTEIYKEWLQSTHAIAFQDPQFQAEWEKDKVYVCLNCHTPLQNQQELIVTGLLDGNYLTPIAKLNPDFDAQLQTESITCATCHVRNGRVIGTGGLSKAPHPTIKDVQFLSEKLCLGCHNAVDELTPVLVCTFETGDEWQREWASKEGKNCISCHMPETQRSIVPEGQVRLSHSHRWPGSGIPKFYGRKAEGLNGLEIKEDSVKSAYRVGEVLRYSLSLKNSFAGHKVPTGDPERFFLINFRAVNIENKILLEKEYRIGEQWQWYPQAKKLAENNLNPREKRDFVFELKLKEKGKVRLEVEITRHRMSKKNAAYMGLLKVYPLSVTVFSRKYAMEVNEKEQ